jgi:NAD(P) transhydrogenase subunit alpha
MYSRNIVTFLGHLVKQGEVALDLADEITRETLITHAGEIVHQRVRQALGMPEAAGAQETTLKETR